MMTSHVAPLLFAWVLVNQAGVPVPVVPSLLATGALAAHGRIGVLVPVVVTVAATLVADLMWYGFGRWRGRQTLARLGRLSRRSAARVESAERRFRAHQFGFLLSSRFLPEANPIAAGMAGATGIVLGRYLLIATTSALAWALTWTGAGYALGHVMGQIPTPLGFVMTLGPLAGAILAVCLVLKRRRRRAIVLVLLVPLMVLGVTGCAQPQAIRGHGSPGLADADRAEKYELYRIYLGAVATVQVNCRSGELRVEHFAVVHDTRDGSCEAATSCSAGGPRGAVRVLRALVENGGGICGMTAPRAKSF